MTDLDLEIVDFLCRGGALASKNPFAGQGASSGLRGQVMLKAVRMAAVLALSGCSAVAQDHLGNDQATMNVVVSDLRTNDEDEALADKLEMAGSLDDLAHPSAAATKALEDVEYGEAGGFTIYRATSECYMASAFVTKSGLRSLLSISYNDRLGSVNVIFNDASVKSLKTGDKKDLEVFFIKVGGGFDDGWGKSSFEANVDDASTYFSAKFPKQMLIDVARYEAIGFFYKDVLVQNFPLTGSAAAVAMLQRCAAEAARTNPSDPFTK